MFLKSSRRNTFLFSFLFAFLFSTNILAQYTYSRASIPVRVNGQLLKHPFVGGFNAPQFNEIDLNFDGKLDLVIFDRSGERLTTFLNQGAANTINYVYAPQYESYFPRPSSWLQTRDYNCDGKMDLFLGSSNITVYENTSSGNTLSFNLVRKIRSYYDPNDPYKLEINPGKPNKVGVSDIDNDGDIDLIMPFSFGSQYEIHRNLSVERTGLCGLDFERTSHCWGDITESNRNSTIYLDSCRWGNLPNGELTSDQGSENFDTKNKFYEVGNEKGLKHGNASISIFDLDNSGGIDLLLGDDGSPRMIALFNADTTAPFDDSHVYKTDSIYPSYDQPIDLTTFPAAYFVDVDNDNLKDMIVSTNSNDAIVRAFYKDNVHLYKNNGGKQPFHFIKNNFLQDDMLDFGKGSYPVFFDYNNDGLKDILVGNEGYLDTSINRIKGQLALLENVGTALNPEYDLVDINFANISSYPLDLSNNEASYNIIPTLADLDNDGDKDMIIGDVTGKIHYFEDTSSMGNHASFKLESAAFQQVSTYIEASPFLFDVSGDGLFDLIIGNSLGRLQYHQNLGSSTQPIFNLDVQSITWQAGSTIRYQLNGNPNLSYLQIGQKIDINNASNLNNDVIQTISAINNTQKYIDCQHPFRNDGSDDEPNSTAVIDYSDKMWGNIWLKDGNSTPFIYKENQELKLIIGSQYGKIFFYDSLKNNLNGGTFHLIDSLYTGLQAGDKVFINGTDLNSDGMIDLVVGNQAGGITIMYAKSVVGLEATTSSIANNQLFEIYPNPSSNSFSLKIRNDAQSISEVKMFDISGRILWESRIDGYQVIKSDHNFSSGIYLIKVKNGDSIQTKKLVIR